MCKHCPAPDLEPFLPLVRKGAAFLDENGPADWRGSIAPTKLDLGNGGTCVLGQVYGDYSRGLDRLGICDEFAGTAGFATPDVDFAGSALGATYDEDAWDRALTAAWRQVLAEPRDVAV